MELRDKIPQGKGNALDTRALIVRQDIFAFCRITALILFCSSLLISAGQAAENKSGPANAAILDHLEQRLYFTKFSEDADEARIARLEQRIFGEKGSGPFNDRLKRLNAALEQIGNTSANTNANPSTELKSATPTPPPPQQAPLQQTPLPNRSSQEDDIQRARLSVQAAREQEIRNLVMEGTELWRTRRGQEALERFEQALRLDPSNAEAHFSMGIIEESSGNYIEAASSYQQAAKYAPEVEEYSKAVNDIEKKVQLKQKQVGQSGNIRQLTENANAAFQRKEYISALDLYKQLDGQAPNQARTKYNIGTLYLLLKDHDNALDYYKQAYKLEPSNPRYAKTYKDLSNEIKQVNKESQEIAQENQRGAIPIKVKEKGKKQNQRRMLQVAPMARPVSGQGFGSGQILGQSQPIPPSVPQRQAPIQDPASQAGLFGSSTGDGLLINRVAPGSRAARAGLMPGDYVRALEGTEVMDIRQLTQVLLQYPPTQGLQMMIMRNGNLNVIMF